MKIFPKGLTLTGLAAALVAAAAVYPVQAETLEKVKSEGATIAIANEPPFMLMGADGSPTGAGPDVDMAVLGEAGITKFSAQAMEYGAMIPALQSNRVTFSSMGGLFIRPARCEAVIFSDPVFCSGEALIVPTELADKVKTYKDIADQGLTVGVCGGCTEQQMAVAAGVPEDKIVVFPDGTSGLKLLTDKRIDVLGHDTISAADLYKRIGDTKTFQYARIEDAPLSCAGAAFNKDSPELRDAYNSGLKKIRESGKFMEILKKYGLEEVAVGVDKVTTEQLCTK